ncbi:LysR family substrate-binding domain-containing protein [Nocardia sp. alder85J]|nr:LysR family substrate-binding domain-containing protein [Nocardia sp. alder85J]
MRQRSRTLTVGFHTRIGRGLIPGVTADMARTEPDRRLHFRQISWADPTVGLADDTVDIAVAWLPLPDTTRFGFQVVAREDRWVALPLHHRLAARPSIPFAELAAEPVVALPATAGPLRDFWLATDHRTVAPVIAAETETAEETFEAIAAGLGIALVAEGNTHIYDSPDVVFRPVTGIAPSELAVVWRADDHRPILRTFVSACTRCLCGPSAQSAATS